MRMEELQMLAPTTFPQTSQINLSLVAAKASSPSEKRKDHCKKQMIGREKRKDQVQMVLHSRKASQKDLPSILLWLKLHQMVHVIIIVINCHELHTSNICADEWGTFSIFARGSRYILVISFTEFVLSDFSSKCSKRRRPGHLAIACLCIWA